MPTDTATGSRYIKLQHLGASQYNVFADGEKIGQVLPSPLSSVSKPLWTAYRLNPDGYLGPLGSKGTYDVRTRREAVARLEKATASEEASDAD